MTPAHGTALTASLLLALVGTIRAAPTQPVEIAPFVDLDELTQFTGFTIEGNDENDYSASSVAFLGDINADGFDDIAISAPRANALAGEVYVIFGRNDAIPAADTPGLLNGTNGFYIQALAAGDRTGTSVASAGDVNGDKIPDIIVGVPSFDGTAGEDAGRAGVIFGRNTARDGNFPSVVFVHQLDGTNGFRVEGEALGDELGKSVASAGDFNGDNIGDIIIGAPPYGSAGKAYIVFGRKKNAPFPAQIAASSLDGTNGLKLTGVATGDGAGTSVAGLGDINGDKIGDVIIGAPTIDPDAVEDAGGAYVVFGRKATPANPIPAETSLGDLDGSNGFLIRGIAEYDYCGGSVSSAGDVNADKIPDILVGAFSADPGAHTNAGQAYVIFGRKSNNPFPATIDPSTLTGVLGFRVASNTDFDNVGRVVARAGDINADKVADFLLTATGANSGRGYTYVVYGRNTARDGGFPADVDLANLDGIDGFVIYGTSTSYNSGEAAASAGDFNGDGISDIIIGAPENTVGADDYAGETFVLFGPKPEIQVSPIIFDPIFLGATEIVDGSTANLGALNVGEARSFAVDIQNLGFAELSLSNFKLPRGFTVINLPAATVSALGTETLAFAFEPSRAGSFSGKISFTTNDADEKKFDFTLEWTAQAMAAAASTIAAPAVDVDSIPDLNNDWITNAADLPLMLRAISESDPTGDLNHDNRVDADDLVILLSRFEAR